MAWEQISSGVGINLNNVISDEENNVAEGQRAKIDCECLVPVGTYEIDSLQNSLSWAGVTDLTITASGTTLSISWRKGFPFAAIIILALIAIIVVVSWLLFREVPDNAKPVVAIAVAAGVIGLVFLFIGRKK